jgi:hypothetical protein
LIWRVMSLAHAEDVVSRVVGIVGGLLTGVGHYGRDHQRVGLMQCRV